MHFHGKNMANAYDFIDKAVLPEEYLPDDYKGPSAGPEKQIIGNTFKLIANAEIKTLKPIALRVTKFAKKKYHYDVASGVK